MKYFNIEIELEEEKYNKFKEIINQKGKSFSQIVTMIVDKTIEVNDIDWLYTSINGEVRSKNIKTKTAVNLLRKKGYDINLWNSTFASKNARNDVYWLNPDKRHLEENWYVILNDYINKKLYLLYIPKNSINKLKMRNDRICNISITYDDNLIDIHSGINFKQFLVDTFYYESLIN